MAKNSTTPPGTKQDSGNLYNFSEHISNIIGSMEGAPSDVIVQNIKQNSLLIDRVLKSILDKGVYSKGGMGYGSFGPAQEIIDKVRGYDLGSQEAAAGYFAYSSLAKTRGIDPGLNIDSEYLARGGYNPSRYSGSFGAAYTQSAMHMIRSSGLIGAFSDGVGSDSLKDFKAAMSDLTKIMRDLAKASQENLSVEEKEKLVKQYDSQREIVDRARGLASETIQKRAEWGVLGGQAMATAGQIWGGVSDFYQNREMMRGKVAGFSNDLFLSGNQAFKGNDYMAMAYYSALNNRDSVSFGENQAISYRLSRGMGSIGNTVAGGVSAAGKTMLATTLGLPTLATNAVIGGVSDVSNSIIGGVGQQAYGVADYTMQARIARAKTIYESDRITNQFTADWWEPEMKVRMSGGGRGLRYSSTMDKFGGYDKIPYSMKTETYDPGDVIRNTVDVNELSKKMGEPGFFNRSSRQVVTQSYSKDPYRQKLGFAPASSIIGLATGGDEAVFTDYIARTVDLYGGVGKNPHNMLNVMMSDLTMGSGAFEAYQASIAKYTNNPTGAIFGLSTSYRENVLPFQYSQMLSTAASLSNTSTARGVDVYSNALGLVDSGNSMRTSSLGSFFQNYDEKVMSSGLGLGQINVAGQMLAMGLDKHTIQNIQRITSAQQSALNSATGKKFEKLARDMGLAMTKDEWTRLSKDVAMAPYLSKMTVQGISDKVLDVIATGKGKDSLSPEENAAYVNIMDMSADVGTDAMSRMREGKSVSGGVPSDPYKLNKYNKGAFTDYERENYLASFEKLRASNLEAASTLEADKLKRSIGYSTINNIDDAKENAKSIANATFSISSKATIRFEGPISINTSGSNVVRK